MKTRRLPTILEAMTAPKLFARWFRDPTTWSTWSVFLSVLFGLPIDPTQAEIFRQCTGRSFLPGDGFSEAWLICGRRAGKSLILALCAVFLAVFKDWSGKLVPGERGTVLVIAADRRQARVIFRYITALITETLILAKLVDGEVTQERIDLKNNISIEISTASFRSVRGYTLVACLADEVAFWMDDDAANPATEVLAAVRPAMATMAPDAMLLCASSPYSQKGTLYDAYAKHYGRDDAPVLVWKAATRTMNPTVPQSEVDAAYARDPAKAAAEYGAEFRRDITGFLSRELIMEAVDVGVTSRPRISGVEHVSFADAASGIAASGDGDRFAMAVGHLEGDVVVIDHAQIWLPPFNASTVTAEVAAIAKSFGCFDVCSDGFSAGFFRSELSRNGMGHRISEFSKSECYLAALPAFTSRKLRLLDQKLIIDEFASLERKTGSGGHDRIDARGHEDGANVVAGVVAMLAAAKPTAGAGLLQWYKEQSEAITNTAPPTLAQEHAEAAVMQIGQKPQRPADHVLVLVPGEPSHVYGISGVGYPTDIAENGDRVCLMAPDDARAFISSPMNMAAFDLNADLRERIGNTLSRPRGIRVVDMLAAAEDARETDPFDKSRIAAQSFAMMRRARP
jgi:hypothetical protein